MSREKKKKKHRGYCDLEGVSKKFLIAALNMILVGSFWIGAGSASHTLTPRNKGVLMYLSVLGRLNAEFYLIITSKLPGTGLVIQKLTVLGKNVH